MSVVDPDHPDFVRPGDMPARIRAYCERTGQPVTAVHVVGGGARNHLLNRLTADAYGVPVVAGSRRLGNVLVQLVTLGELAGLEDAREAVRRGAPGTETEPAGDGRWDELYGRYRAWVADDLAAAGLSAADAGERGVPGRHAPARQATEERH